MTVRPCAGARWPRPEAAALHVGEQTFESPFDPNAQDVIFHDVLLERGPLRLGVDIRDEKGVIGAYQVELERTGAGDASGSVKENARG